MSIQQTNEEGALRCSQNDVLRDDQGLVLKAKSGHSGAFGELYERHRSRVYRTAFRALRNRQDAEDAVQQSFQHAFTYLHRFSKGFRIFNLGAPHSDQSSVDDAPAEARNHFGFPIDYDNVRISNRCYRFRKAGTFPRKFLARIAQTAGSRGKNV